MYHSCLLTKKNEKERGQQKEVFDGVPKQSSKFQSYFLSFLHYFYFFTSIVISFALVNTMEVDEPVAATAEATPEPEMSESPEEPESKEAAAASSEEQNSSDENPADDDDTPQDDNNTTSTEEIEKDPTEIITQALIHKDEGNNSFKSGDLTKASRSYRKGTSLLKPLNSDNLGDEQVKELLVNLQTNLSMVCFKQEKYQQSKEIASKVLSIKSDNVKALYRRAVASRKVNDYDTCKADLKQALKLDPGNKAVRKELIALKKDLEDYNQKQKASLAKAFQKGGSFLYEDKEEEEKKRLLKLKEKEEEEKKAREKRKTDWEDECVQCMSRGEEAISFEDYEKDLKEKEEAEEKARKKLKKEQEEKEKERKRKEREERKKKEAQKKEAESDSDDELTEKELQMLRGYKKTSDGRTTSYFTREQTEEEKNLLGSIAPQRLDANPATTAPQKLGTQSSNVSKGSAWNNAGTWEEKDTSDWCHSTLTNYLNEAAIEIDHCSAKVQKVKDLSGDASVAFVSGKKRYVFDYNASLQYSIFDEGDEKIAGGTLKLPDISSVGINEELEIEILVWKKSPSEDQNAIAIKCRDSLVAQVRSQVHGFVSAFNAEY